MPTPQAQQVEWLTREDAASQLQMKERRLRDYIAAGKIHQRDGLLHAGDVARVQSERHEKKTDAKIRALATMEPEVRKVTKLAETRAALLLADAASANRELQLGSAATGSLPDCAWLTLAEAERYLGLPASVLLQMVEGGKLPAMAVGVRPGGRWRLRRGDLDAIRADVQP